MDAVKFIVMICDEAAMNKEADQWIGITKLTACEKITGMWLIGDHNQLKPLIVSKGVGLNMFALQLEYALFTRVISAGNKCYALELSGRMHEMILRFPNKRTYNGTLAATRAANARELPSGFQK